MSKELSKIELADIFMNNPQGIIVLEADNTIQAINPKAEKLLAVTAEKAIGLRLQEICPQLIVHEKIMKEVTTFINGTKIKTHLFATGGLPGSTKFILFMEVVPHEEKWDTLANVINTIDDAVMVCDKQGKLIIYNEAAQRMDGLLQEQVLGKHVTHVYLLTQEQSLLLRAMKLRKPILNQYQNYTTYTGKNLNIVCSTYPLFKDNEIVGAVSIMKDYSKIKELSDKIIDLQEQLNEKNRVKVTQKTPGTAKYTFKDIIGISSSLQKTITWAQRAARTNSPVLIYGETGTGKELFSQSIHNASPRRKRPFLAVNCAAIPENLLEGILFGTVKGAFTGAVDRPGLFEQAAGGTLLLDELNSMSIGLQAKLLRVLQEGTVRRLGGVAEIPVDVRVISNLNVEPTLAIEKKQLREDLYYRLSVVYLKIPPLKERKEDIPLLAKHFITSYNTKMGKQITEIATDVMEMFIKYSWPGNVREFQHAIESAMNVLTDEETILLPEHLPAHIRRKLDPNPQDSRKLNLYLENEPLSKTLEKVEQQVIFQALERNQWNVSLTARQLGLRRQSLQYRVKKYCLKQPS